MSKSKIDDGFYSYLVEDASFSGDAGIPNLMNLQNVSIPKDLIPFDKAMSGRTKDKRKFIHFYLHDRYINQILTDTKRFVSKIQMYDGIITPDFSLIAGRSRCLQETNTYFNRAVGFYMQKQGVPVIPNIRWSDKESYSFCFLGIPKHYTVAISTHGCIQNKELRAMFDKGVAEMLKAIEPDRVLVYGRFPDDIFGKYQSYAEFYHYSSYIEKIHYGG